MFKYKLKQKIDLSGPQIFLDFYFKNLEKREKEIDNKISRIEMRKSFNNTSALYRSSIMKESSIGDDFSQTNRA